MMFFLKAGLVLSAWSAPLAEHEKQIADINHKTEQFEVRIKDLNERKAQAREGDELEGVITEITNVHKEILSLRKERNALKEHLAKDHPDSNLLFEKSLHKSFDKKQDRGPLDDKLDSMIKLMQSQYGVFLAKKKSIPEPDKETQAASKKVETTKVHMDPVVVENAPKLSPEEEKNRYMRETIKSEMSIKAAPGSVPKKPKEPKPAEKKEEGGHH